MDKENYVLVSGRAFARKGYAGFRRGGVLWPSPAEDNPDMDTDPGLIGLVHRDLYPVLRREKMIAITKLSEDELPPGVEVESLPVFELPARAMVDEAANALDAVKKLDAEIEREKALAALADKQAELALLRAAREAKEKAQAASDAKKAPKAPQAQKSPKAEA